MSWLYQIDRSIGPRSALFTARADDSHATPVQAPLRVVPLSLHYHLHVKPR